MGALAHERVVIVSGIGAQDPHHHGGDLSRPDLAVAEWMIGPDDEAILPYRELAESVPCVRDGQVVRVLRGGLYHTKLSLIEPVCHGSHRLGRYLITRLIEKCRWNQFVL